MSHAKPQSRKGKKGKEKLSALATLREISFFGSGLSRSETIGAKSPMSRYDHDASTHS